MATKVHIKNENIKPFNRIFQVILLLKSFQIPPFKTKNENSTYILTPYFELAFHYLCIQAP